jgi:hypothetical protein
MISAYAYIKSVSGYLSERGMIDELYYYSLAVAKSVKIILKRSIERPNECTLGPEKMLLTPSVVISV